MVPRMPKFIHSNRTVSMNNLYSTGIIVLLIVSGCRCGDYPDDWDIDMDVDIPDVDIQVSGEAGFSLNANAKHAAHETEPKSDT